MENAGCVSLVEVLLAFLTFLILLALSLSRYTSSRSILRARPHRDPRTLSHVVW